MNQYLIQQFTDTTGHTFTHALKVKENETFRVVEAESKTDAVKKAEDNQ